MAARPELSRVLETVLYYTDQERTEAFYREVLGLRLLDREPGRSLFFRAGESVFLLFHADPTSRSGKLPPHGARGPIHTCFEAAAGSYEAWKGHLTAHRVPILREVEWSAGGLRSCYFEDPHGNLLEIAEADIWPP